MTGMRIPYSEIEEREEIIAASSSHHPSASDATSVCTTASSTASLLPAPVVKVYTVLKSLAQCQILLGLVCLAVGALADYVSGRSSSLRFMGLPEGCGLYFILTGLIGICGSASYRRGLVIAFLVMCLHAATIFVPAILVSSSMEIHMFRKDCWYDCGSNSDNDSLACQVLCGSSAAEAIRRGIGSITKIAPDYRIDVGLIMAACTEFFLALITVGYCVRGICESCGIINESSFYQIAKLTTLKPKYRSDTSASSIP